MALMNSRCVFLNEWVDADATLLKGRFALSSTDLNGVELLLASYHRDACGGEAFVLFRKDGVLYEVNASHDSSDGIEGQWEPEDTLISALRYRLEKGRLGRADGGGNLFAEELRFLLAELEAEGQR